MLTRSHLEVCQSCNNSKTNHKLLKNLSYGSRTNKKSFWNLSKSCSSNNSSANEKSFKNLSLAVVALIESCSKIYHSLTSSRTNNSCLEICDSLAKSRLKICQSCCRRTNKKLLKNLSKSCSSSSRTNKSSSKICQSCSNSSANNKYFRNLSVL